MSLELNAELFFGKSSKRSAGEALSAFFPTLEDKGFWRPTSTGLGRTSLIIHEKTQNQDKLSFSLLS